jgi:hypothetical protein
VAVVPVQAAPADRGAAQVDLGVAPADNAANAPDLRKAAPTDPHHHPDPMAHPLAAPMDRRHPLAPTGPLPLTDNVAPAAPDSAVLPVAQVARAAQVGLVAGVDPASTQNACSLMLWNSTPTKTAA